MTLTENQHKQQHYHPVKLTNKASNQRKIIEQAKFTYSLLGKAFEKQAKTIVEQGRKQIDAITNQSERLAALTNKDERKDNYKEIFEELIEKRFDEIK